VATAVADILDNPIDEYRRKARRLRCRYAGQPATLQLGLRLLANEFRPAVREVPLIPGPARQFADYLSQRRAASVLRYSERLDLIRAARHFGVDRFEANLLIASVLERGRQVVEEKPMPGRESVIGKVAMFAVVQSVVLLGAWWMLLR
jgi:hypothetical protein